MEPSFWAWIDSGYGGSGTPSKIYAGFGEQGREVVIVMERRATNVLFL